jgi:L-glyceraldehyde 3-phosphate reductase
VEQLDNSLDALKQLDFTTEELLEINRYAQDVGIDIWKEARESAA